MSWICTTKINYCRYRHTTTKSKCLAQIFRFICIMLIQSFCPPYLTLIVMKIIEIWTRYKIEHSPNSSSRDICYRRRWQSLHLSGVIRLILINMSSNKRWIASLIRSFIIITQSYIGIQPHTYRHSMEKYSSDSWLISRTPLFFLDHTRQFYNIIPTQSLQLSKWWDHIATIYRSYFFAKSIELSLHELNNKRPIIIDKIRIRVQKSFKSLYRSSSLQKHIPRLQLFDSIVVGNIGYVISSLYKSFCCQIWINIINRPSLQDGIMNKFLCGSSSYSSQIGARFVRTSKIVGTYSYMRHIVVAKFVCQLHTQTIQRSQWL